MKIHQFDGLNEIDQLLQNNKSELTINKQKQQKHNQISLSFQLEQT